MEKITYYGESHGIYVEQMVRSTQFNMETKHFHSQYEIFYIIEGERLFFLDNREYTAHAGDLILVDSNQIHMTRSLNTGVVGHNRIILYIDRSKLESFEALMPNLRLVHFFQTHYGVYTLSEEERNRFLHLYHQLRSLLRGDDSDRQTGTSLEVLTYLYHLTHFVRTRENSMAVAADSLKHRTVYQIADYLSEHCEDITSIDQIARQFFLSKSYLCHAFKDVTGYTISEFKNIHRIRKAVHCLSKTSDSISDIAFQLGFESLTYFGKIFKFYMSISPLQFRKAQELSSHTALRALLPYSFSGFNTGVIRKEK